MQNILASALPPLFADEVIKKLHSSDLRMNVRTNSESDHFALELATRLMEKVIITFYIVKNKEVMFKVNISFDEYNKLDDKQKTFIDNLLGAEITLKQVSNEKENKLNSSIEEFIQKFSK
jgi:D-hexose-6-phosphate mutarotase